jgi:transcriptional regulator GlxA family with amidase domain
MVRVTFLLFDQFQVLDVTGPATVFEVAGHFAQPYDLAFVSSAGGPVRSSGGMCVDTSALDAASTFDILFVPGADHLGAAMGDDRLLWAIRRAHLEGRRVASVCSGAFILAAAGLLDSRRAATHWAAVSELGRRFPAVRVDADSLFVEDQGVWTSAGVASGIDLALAMVARDRGEAVARKVAQKLVVYYRRPGAQSQHSALLDLVTPDNRFAALLAWARARLSEPLPVERLADEAALSVRQFTRAFTRATGVAPAKAIERLRVEAARAEIEAGARSLDDVARRTGFGGAERMRRAFVKITGEPPSRLRPRAAAGRT